MGTWTPVVANLDHCGIISDYKSGMSVSDIAVKYHARDYHIRKILHNNNITIIKGRFKASYEPHNKADVCDNDIIKLVLEGHEFRNVADILKISINIVRQRCYAHGIKSPGFTHKQATNLKSQIGDLAFQKLNNKQWLYDEYIIKLRPTRDISKELGCGKKAVLTALRRHNIPPRPDRANRMVYRSKSNKCKDFWCDSFWEWKIALRLDENSSVMKFIKEPFPIGYCNDGVKRYFPDFLVILMNSEMFLLEIKADYFLQFAEAKTKAGMLSGFKYYVMTIDDNFPW